MHAYTSCTILCINTYQKIKWTLLWMLKWTKPMRLHIRPHTFSRLGVGPGVWALRERLVCNQVIQTSCCLSCYADNLALVQWGLADRHVDCWWQMVRMMCSTWWEHQSFFAFATVSTRCRVGMQVVNPLVNPSVHLAGTLAGTRAGRGLPGTARWEPGICYWLTGFLAARRPVGMLDLSRGWQRHWAVMIC